MEKASVPAWVTCEAVASSSSVRVINAVLSSASELVTGEISTPFTLGEMVGVGMADPVCDSGCVINETVLSGLPGEIVRV